MDTAVLIALIALVGTVSAGVPAALIQRGRRENVVDHAHVRTKLEELGAMIRRSEVRVTKRIQIHEDTYHERGPDAARRTRQGVPIKNPEDT